MIAAGLVFLAAAFLLALPGLVVALVGAQRAERRVAALEETFHGYLLHQQHDANLRARWQG